MLTVDYAQLGLRPGERLLDVGCGEGRHAQEAYRRGASVVAMDIDTRALAATHERLAAIDGQREVEATFATIVGDATRQPFPDGAFDRVICSETLEHVPDDDAAIGELARVLRPGGRLAVTVPRYYPERLCWALSRAYHESEGGHVRIYRASQLADAFRRLGLRLRARHHAHALHSPYWWLRCIFGPPEDGVRISLWYDRLLVRHLVQAPTPLGALEQLLNPLLGKSVVLYFDK